MRCFGYRFHIILVDCIHIVDHAHSNFQKRWKSRQYQEQRRMPTRFERELQKALGDLQNQTCPNHLPIIINMSIKYPGSISSINFQYSENYSRYSDYRSYLGLYKVLPLLN